MNDRLQSMRTFRDTVADTCLNLNFLSKRFIDSCCRFSKSVNQISDHGFECFQVFVPTTTLDFLACKTTDVHRIDPFPTVCILVFKFSYDLGGTNGGKSIGYVLDISHGLLGRTKGFRSHRSLFQPQHFLYFSHFFYRTLYQKCTNFRYSVGAPYKIYRVDR